MKLTGVSCRARPETVPCSPSPPGHFSGTLIARLRQGHQVPYIIIILRQSMGHASSPPPTNTTLNSHTSYRATLGTSGIYLFETSIFSEPFR